MGELAYIFFWGGGGGGGLWEEVELYLRICGAKEKYFQGAEGFGEINALLSGIKGAQTQWGLLNGGGGGGGSAGHRDSELLKLFRSEIHNGLYITILTCTGRWRGTQFIKMSRHVSLKGVLFF